MDDILKKTKRRMPKIPDDVAQGILNMAQIKEDVQPESTTKKRTSEDSISLGKTSQIKVSNHIENKSKSFSLIPVPITIDQKNFDSYKDLIDTTLKNLDSDLENKLPEIGERKVITIRLPWEIYQLFLMQIQSLKQQVKSYSVQNHVSKLILQNMHEFFGSIKLGD